MNLNFIYMRIAILLLFFQCFQLAAQTKTIHVFVALCDNENQGIVPVPPKIGNGQDPNNNLYWGCGYGVRSFLKLKTTDWVYQGKLACSNRYVLERVLFKHATKDVYLLADAYDGIAIKSCIEDFLLASNGQHVQKISHEKKELSFGGGSDLLSYVGHDGLMDFTVNLDFTPITGKNMDVIILACYSKNYFSPFIQAAGANPILWTTHLMAPEAYTLKAAIDGWLLGETGAQIDERAAQTYHAYQKCGIKGARNLFTTGF